MPSTTPVPVPTVLAVTFPVVPAAPTAILTIQSVTSPAGMSVVGARIFQQSGFSGDVQTPVLPYVFSSLNPPQGIFTVEVLAFDPYSGDWSMRLPNQTLGSVVSFTSTFTAAPTLTANQSGGTIAYSSNATATIADITLRDISTGSSWFITVNPQTTGVSLPAVPASITNPFIIGNQYDLSFSLYVFNGYSHTSFNQAWTSETPFDFETIEVESVTSLVVPYTY
ncbi:MAG: hypothetical protein Q9M44_01285 [Ghiorsea sp.]|nr:hypothetical protein [Ghiorsea sp.]